MAPDFFNTTHEPPRSNWNMGLGYKHAKDVEPYPFRVFGTGQQFSLSILLRVLSHDLDYLCGGSTQGFKLTFHPPNEGNI